MESNNSGSSVAALTGAMMRPEVEVTHHWVEGLLQVEVERAQGEENQSFSTIQQRFDMYCLSLCVIPWLRKTNAPPP